MSDDATVVERSRSVSRVGRILEILIAAKTIVACLALYWMVRELVALVHVRGTGNTEAPEIQAVVAAGRFVFVVNTPACAHSDSMMRNGPDPSSVASIGRPDARHCAVPPATDAT